MIWLYRILFIPGLLLSSPYYLYRMRKRGGYLIDWKHRFGGMPEPPKKKPGVTRIWIQAVSVGEIQAIEPLIESWINQSGTEVCLTTTTSTGYRLAREKLSGKVLALGIFPLDFLPFSVRTWNRLKPDLAVLMESELWPEHIHQATNRNIPVVLINARLSDRSFRKYGKWPGVARWILHRLSLILAATERDAKRFRTLALAQSRDKIITTGNLKLDVEIKPVLNKDEKKALLEEMGFSPRKKPCPLILLGSSTWHPEEIFLLDLQKSARAGGIDCRLLIAPRHAERGDDIACILEKQPLPWHRRTTQRQAPSDNCIYLADTTGELRRLAQVADLALIGKSLPPNTEGQTPIECAALGIPFVTGPGMSNFSEVIDAIERVEGCRRGKSTEETALILLQLLRDDNARRSLSEAARIWHQSNRGSARKTLDALNSLLPGNFESTRSNKTSSAG